MRVWNEEEVVESDRGGCHWKSRVGGENENYRDAYANLYLSALWSLCCHEHMVCYHSLRSSQ